MSVKASSRLSRERCWQGMPVKASSRLSREVVEELEEKVRDFIKFSCSRT